MSSPSGALPQSHQDLNEAWIIAALTQHENTQELKKKYLFQWAVSPKTVASQYQEAFTAALRTEKMREDARRMIMSLITPEEGKVIIYCIRQSLIQCWTQRAQVL